MALGVVAAIGCGGDPVDHDPDRDGIADDCVIPEQGLPDDVFCIGLYLDRDRTQYVESVMPYTPGVTLWSDGAEKHRYLYLPPDGQIDTTTFDAWNFPVGTRAWKEFAIGGAPIETRVLWKRGPSDWETGTYIWDAAGADAALDTSKKPTIVADGYEIPTAKDCGKCHHGGADKLLGIEAVALALPAAEGVTLARLVADGSLTAPPNATSIALPEDVTGKAGAALGYLHANCGMPCHSSRGLGDETELILRLRADEFWPPEGGEPSPVDATQTEAYLATVEVESTTASVAQKFPDALRIIPGAHEQSLLWLMSHRRDDYAMPPLVSHRVDEQGTQALADWIDAIPH
jgi:hypothetical protein